MENIPELDAKNVLSGFAARYATVYRVKRNSKPCAPFFNRHGFSLMMNSFGVFLLKARSKRPFRRLSMLESVPNSCPLYSSDSRPFANGMRFSVKGDALRPGIFTARSSIERLLSRCGPSAISGFVVAVVVGPTVKAMEMRRSFSHVGEEILKRVNPAFAYLYAAASVILEGWVCGACASGLHRIPTMKSGRASVGGVSVSRIRSYSGSDNLTPQTPATFDLAAAYMRAFDNFCFPAVALKNPISWIKANALNRHNSAEPETRDIFEFCHSSIIQDKRVICRTF